MIDSKPRHGEPIGEIRDGRVYPTRQFQHYLDDIEKAIQTQAKQIADLEQRVTDLEP